MLIIFSSTWSITPEIARLHNHFISSFYPEYILPPTVTMQPKSLAALLLASMAMAAPADTNSAIESGDAGLADIIPPSIAVVLATAVPSSFWAEATNTAAFLSQVEQGIVSNSWPTWYSSLPDSVKAYVTTAVEGYYPSFASSVSAEITSSGASSSGPSTAEATSTGASSSGASSSGAASSGASRLSLIHI